MNNDIDLKNYDINSNHFIYDSHMFVALYKNEQYDAYIDENYKIKLYSYEQLGNTSVFVNDHYETEVKLSELDDILQNTFYAKYHNNMYFVFSVNGNFDFLRLVKLGGFLTLDEKKLGFLYDEDTDEFYKDVSKNDVQQLFVNTVSVYDNIKVNMKTQFSR